MSSTNENIDANADELVAPGWLNAQFLENALSKYENAPELKVVSVNLSPASAKGDHYASVMFRGNVAYTTQSGNHSKSLIIKTMPEAEGHKKEMLKDSHLFKTEIGMYTKVLPRFEQILKASGDESRLGAICIYHSIEPREVIIFEDLVPQGYAVIRDRETTVEEIKVALTKLAKLHAVSFKTLRETPDFLNEFQYGICEIPNILNDPFITSGLTNFLELLDSRPEFAKYRSYFRNIANTYLDLFVDIVEEYRKNKQPNGYYVLCHGDFHLRNMMFKHNTSDQSIEDCMLIDYQICNICPITIDLIYATYMLLSPENRQHNLEELIEFYFSTFVQTLKQIGYKGELPNFAEFQRQMTRHNFYDLFLIFAFLPMLHGIRANVDITEVLQQSDVRKKLFFQDNYVEDVKFLLAKFEKFGYFD
ncbi:PREDICTED: uncharacterized protein LOC108620976 [Drosophila arizonae]|uniref:Uncharacterized protein LOC108620976 n=1 Tax=Drosophila arizonae TaxID=7263 RepID=A0ABM1Q236_DROAR|nr:PREDICTED: uncharacterized protein LOC108620976 [Drosophila arizonae]